MKARLLCYAHVKQMRGNKSFIHAYSSRSLSIATRFDQLFENNITPFNKIHLYSSSNPKPSNRSVRQFSSMVRLMSSETPLGIVAWISSVTCTSVP